MLPGSLPVYPVFECLLPSRRKRERVDGRQGDGGEARGESLGCGVVGTRRKQLEAFEQTGTEVTEMTEFVDSYL